MNEVTPNYYAVIPADVRYCKTIPPNAKLLFGEITALCNKEGYCWATNEYFANLYGVKVLAIKRWMKALEGEGFVHVLLDVTGTRRRICIDEAVSKKIRRGIKNDTGWYPKRCTPRIKKDTLNTTGNDSNKNQRQQQSAPGPKKASGVRVPSKPVVVSNVSNEEKIQDQGKVPDSPGQPDIPEQPETSAQGQSQSSADSHGEAPQQPPAAPSNAKDASMAVDAASQRLLDKFGCDADKVISSMRQAGDTEEDIAKVLNDTLAVMFKDKNKEKGAGFAINTMRNMSSARRVQRGEQDRAAQAAEKRKKDAYKAACGSEAPAAVIARYQATVADNEQLKKELEKRAEAAASEKLGLSWGEMGVDKRREARKPFLLSAFLEFERTQVPPPAEEPSDAAPAASQTDEAAKVPEAGIEFSDEDAPPEAEDTCYDGKE